MSDRRRIEIYDTTLRDGTQGEGFNLSLQDKLMIARRLDELGVDYIEGGFPLSNPKDAAFFRDVREMKLKHAKVAAFGMTRRRGVRAEEDPGMRALLEAETPVVTLVGKTSPSQVERVMNVSLEENVKMIGDSVRLMKSAGRQVVYDAEHFFDAFHADRAYALRTLAAAQEAGASVLCLCDTNGGTMPEQVEEAVTAVRQQSDAKIGIHTHTDAGLALANARVAVRAGAGHAQGTMNGVGERCGNMDLIPLVVNLRLKYGLDCLEGPDNLRHLTEASRFVYETANMNLSPGQPYVGSSAFAHKGACTCTRCRRTPAPTSTSPRAGRQHAQGDRQRAVRPIEHRRQGGQEVRHRVRQGRPQAGAGARAGPGERRLPVRGRRGELRADAAEGDRAVPAVLRAGPLPRDRPALADAASPISEASVKLHVNDKAEHCVAEGDGPVNALDGALRRAARDHYPAIADVHLLDYKVRDQLQGGDGRPRPRRDRVPPRPGRRHEGDLRHDRREREHHRRELARWSDAREYHLIHVGEAQQG